MKKTASATLVIAAPGTCTAPLALAQSGGYLNHRQSIDSLENINSVYQGVESARTQVGDAAQSQDYVAERQNIDQLSHINAVYDAVSLQRELAANSVPTGEVRDYQAERNNLDSLSHINDVLKSISRQSATIGERTVQL